MPRTIAFIIAGKNEGSPRSFIKTTNSIIFSKESTVSLKANLYCTRSFASILISGLFVLAIFLINDLSAEPELI